jgi:hypothetical protein
MELDEIEGERKLFEGFFFIVLSHSKASFKDDLLQ